MIGGYKPLSYPQATLDFYINQEYNDK